MATQSTNQDWLALTEEQALEPDLPICDPHHHLWTGRVNSVQTQYLIDEFRDDLAGGHNIVSTVFIECGAFFKTDGPEAFQCIGETETVAEMTAAAASGAEGTTKIAKGIVGTADLKLGDQAADILDRQIEAGRGRFSGIRLGAMWNEHDAIRNHRTNPPAGLLLRDDFRQGFKHLASRNLTFEAWCCHEQIAEVTDLARAFPDTTIILDHFGGPLGIGPYVGKAEEVFDVWRTAIDELATCPNVMAKLGGLNMDINGFGWEERQKPPTSTELMTATRRYFEHTIARFGVERCMFESNFPVDKVSCSYTILWNAFKRLSENFSTHEKAALFRDTAARVYRL